MRSRSQPAPTSFPVGEPSDTSPTLVQFYHSEVFYYLSHAYADRLEEHLHDRPFRFRRSAFLARLPKGTALSGQAAWDEGMRYLDALSSRMQTILQKHSVHFWIHLYRRIGVLLSPKHGEKSDPWTVGLVRTIMELTISKFGDLGSALGDTARTTEIHLKDILGGHFQRFWKEKFKRHNKSIRQTIVSNIMRSGQWVLTKFRIIDLLHTYEIEGLAYEYWKPTAWMRALGKGAAFKLQQNDDWPEPVIARKLARLIASYDSRIERVPFSSSLLGFWFLPGDSVTNLNTSKLFIPIYNVYRAPAPSFSAFGRLADRLTNDDFKPNFTIQTLDLEGFRHSHSFLADEFRTLQGCTLDGFLACLWALCNIVMVPPRVVTAMVENEELGRQAFAYETLNLLQRGYLLFGETQQDLLETILARLSDFETPIKDYEANDIEIALEILTLRDEKRDQIGLWSGGRRFVVMPMSGGMLLDLQGVPFILNSLFYKLQYEQTERGLIFEEAFREAIKQKGFSLDRVGKIHGSSGSEREIDASVRIDDELILFECRTIERPLDYEIGRPRTLEVRQASLEEKVTQVLSLRDFIISDPGGRNYDFKWAKNIEAFVVSPFVEWIWDFGDRLWQAPDVPRILQANEALAWLETHSTR